MKTYQTSSYLSTDVVPASFYKHLKRREIQVLTLLYRFFSADAKKNPGREQRAWPSRRWIAENLDMSTRTVTRATKRLRLMGLITAFQLRARNGKWHSNVYRLGFLARLWAKSWYNRLKKLLLGRETVLAHKSTEIYKGSNTT